MSDICPTCNKRVYSAEWVVGLGKHYHPRCLCCQGCKKRLNTSEIVEHENKPYCKNCYSKNFGPVGFGAGRSSYADQAEVKKHLVEIGQSAPSSETPASKPETSAPPATTAITPETPVAPPQMHTHEVPHVQPKPEEHPPQQEPAPQSKPKTVAPKKQGDYCPVCGKRVYQAEGLNALGRKYHNNCFRCFNCKAPLTLGKQFEHDGEPYCQKCSNSLFRIKGYGTGANLTTY